MAKLPPMSRHADAIRNALSEGRERDAVKYAIEQLRAGESHQLFLNAVADLLTPKPSRRGAGRPPQKYPPHWLEIGEGFDDLRYKGSPIGAAYTALAEQFGQSEKRIERTVKFYRDAMDEAAAAADEAYREAYESGPARVKDNN